MNRFLFSTAICAGLAVMVMAGCTTSNGKSGGPKPAPQQPAASQQAGTAGKKLDEHADDASVPDDVKKLPAGDRELAIKQKICPVSGQPLGSMGVPGKVLVRGQPVFICCEGCRSPLLAEPDKYLVKLKK